jgi:hypothetical protein
VVTPSAQGARRRIQATCASHLDEKSTGFLGGTLGTQSFNVLCECGGPAQATFSINADTTSHYKGTVTARSASYTIEGVYTDEKGSSSSKPIGYQVRGSDPVGAVEVAGKGRVWLSKSLEPGARGRGLPVRGSAPLSAADGQNRQVARQPATQSAIRAPALVTWMVASSLSCLGTATNRRRTGTRQRGAGQRRRHMREAHVVGPRRRTRRGTPSPET